MALNEQLLKRFLNSILMRETLSDLIKMLEHPNGYKRENAIRRIGMLEEPIAIPYLLIRVNDWVPQVRDAAKEAILRIRTSENATAFVNCLPNLFHLELCGREDHSEFIAKITNYLTQPENKQALIEALHSEKPKVARCAAKLAFNNHPDEKETIAIKCLKHSDVVVRDIAASNFRYISSANLPTIFEIALHDPYMPVRREAFQIYLRNYPTEKPKIAQDFLFDRHVSMREIAIKALQGAGTDVKYIYVKVLSNREASILRTRCSISGLAYLQAQEETQRIMSYLHDTTPSIRKSVAQALEKLHGDKYKETYVRLLNDESPSVAKEAIRLIQKLKIAFKSNELSKIIEPMKYPHTFELSLRAMRLSNKWERLIFLLNKVCDVTARDPKKNEALLSELKKWDYDFNRSYVQPTDQQAKAIKVEFDNCPSSLDRDVQNSIKFTLGTMKII